MLRSGGGAVCAVFAIATVLGGVGCFHAHERVASDAGVDAAVTPRDAHAEPDAFVPSPDAALPDAFTPDAGSCMTPGVGNPRHACVLAATGTLPADEPYTLPLGFARCECPQARSCTVAVVGNVISLTTATCDDAFECDECEFDAPCAIPPLPAGRYFVDVNGARAMEVEAAPRTMPMVARPICAPIPMAPDASLVCELDTRPAPARPISVCRPSFEDVGQYVRFDVVLPCPSCFDLDGGCETQLDGPRLVLRPHLLRCDCPTCGACDPTCVPRTITCVSPPLSSGVYDVIVETIDGEQSAGPLEIRDVFEAGDRFCTEVP
jgi:hypothetical protein